MGWLFIFFPMIVSVGAGVAFLYYIMQFLWRKDFLFSLKGIIGFAISSFVYSFFAFVILSVFYLIGIYVSTYLNLNTLANDTHVLALLYGVLYFKSLPITIPLVYIISSFFFYKKWSMFHKDSNLQ